MANTPNDFLKSIPDVAAIFTDADEIDIKQIESSKTLRQFIVDTLTFQPPFLTFLYRVRWVFVRLLGMTQEGIPRPPHIDPDNVPFTPGEEMVFEVRKAQEGLFWLAGEDEVHLNFNLAIVQEALADNRNRFYVVTCVYYNKLIGRIYFFFIRPFHHVLVWFLMRRGAK